MCDKSLSSSDRVEREIVAFSASSRDPKLPYNCFLKEGVRAFAGVSQGNRAALPPDHFIREDANSFNFEFNKIAVV